MPRCSHLTRRFNLDRDRSMVECREDFDTVAVSLFQLRHRCLATTADHHRRRLRSLSQFRRVGIQAAVMR
jgi:hypothetical protein